MRRTMVIAATALFAGVLGVQGANAQYPPAASCSLSETTVALGETITVSCGGFLPGSTVTVEILSPQVLATATVGADGEVSLAATIPSDLEPGTHTLRISGTAADGSPVVIERTIVVLAAEGVAEEGLAITGGNIMLAVLLFGGLIAAGTSALILGRRRERDRP